MFIQIYGPYISSTCEGNHNEHSYLYKTLPVEALVEDFKISERLVPFNKTVNVYLQN